MKAFRLCFFTLFVLMLGAGAGCSKFHLLRFQSPEKQDEDVAKEDSLRDDDEKSNEEETKVETPLVGDYTSINGLNRVVMEGVGIVVGLDGTGGDPPPSVYREALLNDMRKRDIRDPESILRSPSTALVIVRALLPPLARKGEPFDVDVRVPEGDTTTNLNGGWLLETEMSEQKVVAGQGVMKGHILARAEGPIMVTTGETKGDATGVKLRGKILGGAVAKKDRDLRLQLRSEFKSVRQTRRIAQRIGDRFFAYNQSGQREPLAKALTDQTIELKVVKRYKDNYPRYLQVVKNIAFRETSVARHVRMEKLKSQLLNPDTAEQAALQLEAIGNDAIPTLKTGLKHPDLEVRFNAAMALAYLGQTDAIKVLGEAALNERAFRVYALAALATIEDGETHLLLRDLMSARPDASGKLVDSTEMRYGAFRSLWTLDKRDQFLNEEMLKEPQSGRELFALHAIATEGDPIVHLTHHLRSEIVLFGPDQKFLAPMAARAGNHILVTAHPGKDHVVVSRYQAGKPDQRKEVSPRVADVIRTIVELGGSYPDVAQLLLQAAKQDNLTSRIEIDALPQGGREYVRKTDAQSTDSDKAKKVRVGNANLVPNFVPNLKDAAGGAEKQTWGTEPEKSNSDDTEPESTDNNLTQSDTTGSATAADDRKEVAANDSERKWFEFWKRK